MPQDFKEFTLPALHQAFDALKRCATKLYLVSDIFNPPKGLKTEDAIGEWLDRCQERTAKLYFADFCDVTVDDGDITIKTHENNPSVRFEHDVLMDAMKELDKQIIAFCIIRKMKLLDDEGLFIMLHEKVREATFKHSKALAELGDEVETEIASRVA